MSFGPSEVSPVPATVTGTSEQRPVREAGAVALALCAEPSRRRRGGDRDGDGAGRPHAGATAAAASGPRGYFVTWEGRFPDGTPLRRPRLPCAPRGSGRRCLGAGFSLRPGQGWGVRGDRGAGPRAQRPPAGRRRRGGAEGRVLCPRLISPSRSRCTAVPTAWLHRRERGVEKGGPTDRSREPAGRAERDGPPAPPAPAQENRGAGPAGRLRGGRQLPDARRRRSQVSPPSPVLSRGP